MEKEKQNYIKEFRKRENMSQQELLKRFLSIADGKCLLTQSQLSDIENLRKPLSAEKGAIMCKIFNCKIEEIINFPFLENDENKDKNVIDLNLFSTEQLQKMIVVIQNELDKRNL